MRSPMRSFGEDRILSVLSFGVGMPGSVESGAAGQNPLVPAMGLAPRQLGHLQS